MVIPKTYVFRRKKENERIEKLEEEALKVYPKKLMNNTIIYKK